MPETLGPRGLASPGNMAVMSMGWANEAGKDVDDSTTTGPMADGPKR